MSIKLGVVMDPIQNIDFEKDGTLVQLLEAQRRGWQLFYMEQKDLFLKDSIAYGNMHALKIHYNPEHWFDFGKETTQELHKLNVILMRKDPPFDMEYIFTTYLLELAESKGALVVNKPQSLRDANEKLFISWFPQCCPKTLVARDKQLIHQFLQEQEEIVIKPLGSMGGDSIFHINKKDINANVIIDTITHYGTQFVMAQRYIAEVLKTGDKRIFLVDGEPIPYALIRIPAKGDFRGNIVIGAHGKGGKLTEHDRWICEQVGPEVKKRGLILVGLDVIGDYLTEINVTSPTGIRQIAEFFDFKTETKIIDVIEKKLFKEEKKV